MGISIGISLLSCIQGEIYVISYPLSVAGPIFDILLTLTYDSVCTSPIVLLALKNGGSPGNSLITHSYRDLLVTSGL